MLEVGDTLEIQPLKTGNEKEQNRYKARLVDLDEQAFYIDLPVNKETDRTGFFFEGTEFKISFVKNDSAVYTFRTEVIGRRKTNIPMLVLKRPTKEDYVRIQRRAFVRVETPVDVAVHPKGEQTFRPFQTVTADISAGGAAIVLPPDHPLKEQQEIFCFIALAFQSGAIDYVRTPCMIHRLLEGNETDKRQKATLQFVDLDEGDKEKVIRLCFDRQLEMKRKGIL